MQLVCCWQIIFRRENTISSSLASILEKTSSSVSLKSPEPADVWWQCGASCVRSELLWCDWDPALAAPCVSINNCAHASCCRTTVDRGGSDQLHTSQRVKEAALVLSLQHMIIWAKVSVTQALFISCRNLLWLKWLCCPLLSFTGVHTLQDIRCPPPSA